MTDRIRWGIMATGNIAHSFAQGVVPLDDAEVVAVGSRGQARADSFGDTFGIPRRYGSYEALAADADVDVIYVATPHGRHYDDMLLCIAHGKHILCEKAFTINTTQAEDVFRRADQQNLLVVEAMWTRFLPSFRKIRELIGDGAIGDVRLVMADFGFYAPLDEQSRLFDPELGGGALLDIGIYPIMLALTVLGEPERIESAVHLGETGVDVQEAILFAYPGGQVASLTATFQANTPSEAVIAGTKGRIRLPYHWWGSERFTLLRHNTDPEEFYMPFDHNGYSYEAQEVMRCLRGGHRESDLMPRADTLTLMRTMDALRQQWDVVYPMEG